MIKKKIEEQLAVGRRKTAISSVRLRRGTGKVNVNGRKFEDYFLNEIHRKDILISLEKFSDVSKYDLIIRVKGGGIAAQATATRLGIARALVSGDETLRKGLKELNLLTRDARKKERKKYGLAGARKRFQFSKR